MSDNQKDFSGGIRDLLKGWKDALYLIGCVFIAAGTYYGLISKIDDQSAKIDRLSDKIIQLEKEITAHRRNPEIHQSYKDKVDAFVTRREFGVFSSELKDDLKEIKSLIRDNEKRRNK